MKYIKVKNKNNINIIIINRENALNALNRDVMNELLLTINKLNEDDKCCAIIITGSGKKSFIAGADIKKMQTMNSDEAREFAISGHQITSSIENSSKPIIAAVNGYALGGGCEIALACHIRIASINAIFGQPEVKIGIIPGWGGTQRLPRIVGKGIAAEMIITGRNIDSSEAHRIGLVNHIYPQNKLIDSALRLCNEILKNSPNAVSKSIKQINISSELSIEEGCKMEIEQFADLFNYKETKEGLSAFIEKRTPKYK